MEGSCSVINAEPGNTGERECSGGPWVYGRVCKVRAICPQASGQKGAGVSSSGAGAKKGNCGCLMLVGSRGAENSPIKAMLLPRSSKKAFSMWWCLDAVNVTPGVLVSRIARRAVASCFRKESGNGGVGIPQLLMLVLCSPKVLRRLALSFLALQAFA